MKDQDTKTNTVCYCKESIRPSREHSEVKDAGKETSDRDRQNKLDNGTKQPWSVFEGLYWI
ncbi:MAG: hypothetical protein HY062_12845 [Bacteroidetes bacterium]|nr:hypothetical protein [Bacteroidota bacterium]